MTERAAGIAADLKEPVLFCGKGIYHIGSKGVQALLQSKAAAPLVSLAQRVGQYDTLILALGAAYNALSGYTLFFNANTLFFAAGTLVGILGAAVGDQIGLPHLKERLMQNPNDRTLAGLAMIASQYSLQSVPVFGSISMSFCAGLAIGNEAAHAAGNSTPVQYMTAAAQRIPAAFNAVQHLAPAFLGKA